MQCVILERLLCHYLVFTFFSFSSFLFLVPFSSFYFFPLVSLPLFFTCQVPSTFYFLLFSCYFIIFVPYYKIKCANWKGYWKGCVVEDGVARLANRGKQMHINNLKKHLETLTLRNAYNKNVSEKKKGMGVHPRADFGHLWRRKWHSKGTWLRPVKQSSPI